MPEFRLSVGQQAEQGKEEQAKLPSAQAAKLPDLNEVIKRRADLVQNLRSYGRQNGIKPGSDASLELQRSLAKELGVPDGYVAALYYSSERGAVGRDGLVRGNIRPENNKDAKGTGAPFVVDPNNITGKGPIEFTLGGSRINTESARAVMPALLDRPQRVDQSFIAYSKDGAITLRFDERYPINEGTEGFDRFTNLHVYRDGKLIAQGLSMEPDPSAQGSGTSQERWTWTENEKSHAVDVQVKTRYRKLSPPTREYQSVKVDGKNLEIWKD